MSVNCTSEVYFRTILVRPLVECLRNEFAAIVCLDIAWALDAKQQSS